MVQLYSERGLGSGAGQVEAETASLAKVTFTSEQFISLGVREGVNLFISTAQRWETGEGNETQWNLGEGSGLVQNTSCCNSS